MGGQAEFFKNRAHNQDWWTLIEAASRCVTVISVSYPTTLLSPVQGVQKTWLHNVTCAAGGATDPWTELEGLESADHDRNVGWS